MKTLSDIERTEIINTLIPRFRGQAIKLGIKFDATNMLYKLGAKADSDLQKLLEITNNSKYYPSTDTASYKISFPFTDYRGSEWSQTAIDTYNRACEEVEKREKQHAIHGSLSWHELEFYKDQRHKTFVQLVDIAQNAPRQSTAPAARPDFEQLP